MEKPKRAKAIASLFLLAVITFQSLPRLVDAAAVAVIVPARAVPVADSDLDGFPLTGAWSDAASYTVDLENGEASPYGTATIYFKHNLTNIFIRIDGKIDVAWASASGNHFWIGFQINPIGATGHHRTGQDNIFFGQTSYSGVTYPLTPIDASGNGRPPTKDASQDAFGMARYSGASAPFSFTAEWKRKLNTGDSNDVTLTVGTNVYRFYVTTDSGGGGSSGGGIDHSVVTTDNTMSLASAPVPEFPMGSEAIFLIAPLILILYLIRTRKSTRLATEQIHLNHASRQRVAGSSPTWPHHRFKAPTLFLCV